MKQNAPHHMSDNLYSAELGCEMLCDAVGNNKMGYEDWENGLNGV